MFVPKNNLEHRALLITQYTPTSPQNHYDMVEDRVLSLCEKCPNVARRLAEIKKEINIIWKSGQPEEVLDEEEREVLVEYWSNDDEFIEGFY